MLTAKKIFTYIVLSLFMVQTCGSFVYAEDTVFHSLDELPSSIETLETETTEPIITEEQRVLPDEEVSLSELMQEKIAYDIENTSTESILIEGSALAEEHEMYLAEMVTLAPPTPTIFTP